jgi:hypothetical protein
MQNINLNFVQHTLCINNKGSKRLLSHEKKNVNGLPKTD